MTTPARCIDESTGHLLPRYELGLLDDDERDRFELHLLDCAFCQDELAALGPVMEHLHRHRVELSRLLERDGLGFDRLRDVLLDEAAPKAPRRRVQEPSLWQQLMEWWRRPVVWAPAMAAACLAVLAVLLQPGRGSKYEQYLEFERMPFAGTLVRSSDPAEAAFNRGIDAYQHGDLSTAIQHLRSTTATDPQHGEAWFYMGISYYLQHEAKLAVPALARAAGLVPLELRSPAQWYLAQAHLLNNELALALPILDSLAGSVGPYAESAARLRDRVKATAP